MGPTHLKRYRRISLPLGLIFGLLAVWRGVVLLTPPSDHQTVRLADGAVVELLGYSFGKKHELRPRKPILTLHDLLIFRQTPPILRAAETDREVLLLWVRIPHRLILHPDNSPPFPAYAKGANGYTYPSNLVTYTGVKYSVGDPYNTIHVVGGGGTAPRDVEEEILAIPVSCSPQRESRFTVALVQYGGKQPLANFQIENANTGRPAPFRSEPLPAARQEKDLKVTLESIAAVHARQFVLPNGAATWWSGQGEPKDGVLLAGAEGRQRITLSYTLRGQPDPNWKISELEAFDAMGNRTQEIAAAPGWPCRNYYPPSAGETYKLKLGVQKTWSNRFDTDELWTVNDIPLPTHGKPAPIRREFRRDDLPLQLVRVYGMDGKNFSPDLAIVQIKVETSVANRVRRPGIPAFLGMTLRDRYGI